MEYINPGSCTEHQFRLMWTEFEWENKVNVNTNIKYLYFDSKAARDLREYLNYLLKQTNMSCLTPQDALDGDCNFLSANLYAKSIFGIFFKLTKLGEDALANLSIEKRENGNIIGHVRIRSATQGIALSLGDKISVAQKAI